MALPIGATPVLKGKEAAEFLAKMYENEKIPARPTPTPKLEKARELIKEIYALQEKSR